MSREQKNFVSCVGLLRQLQGTRGVVGGHRVAEQDEDPADVQVDGRVVIHHLETAQICKKTRQRYRKKNQKLQDLSQKMVIVKHFRRPVWCQIRTTPLRNPWDSGWSDFQARRRKKNIFGRV